MVGKKSRSVYRKKRKRNFSGRRKQKEESEETAPDVDEIAASTPSTSRDENQLSDSDSKETVGSSRKKLNIPLLLYSSDEEYTFNTEESEGYRLINVKNLSTAVSKAHVYEKREKFFFNLSFSVLDYDLFPISYRPIVPVFPC